MSQTALSLLAMTISVDTPFIIAMKLASASSSEMFLAMVKPSHHSVVAGVLPPPTVGAPIDPNERLFVTIASGETTLPLMERVQTIYPRYLVAEPVAGPPGLTFLGFRSETPYQGEDLVFESNAPEHFLARCLQKGVTNSGTCLLERRIGNADVTLRFPRDWLDNWSDVSSGIDRLIARLHSEMK